jgi:hypothetical protein
MLAVAINSGTVQPPGPRTYMAPPNAPEAAGKAPAGQAVARRFLVAMAGRLAEWKS